MYTGAHFSNRINRDKCIIYIYTYIYVCVYTVTSTCVYVITHPCPNFNGGLTKPPPKFGRGWIIMPHCLSWGYLSIHALIMFNWSLLVKEVPTIKSTAWYWLHYYCPTSKNYAQSSLLVLSRCCLSLVSLYYVPTTKPYSCIVDES